MWYINQYGFSTLDMIIANKALTIAAVVKIDIISAEPYKDK